MTTNWVVLGSAAVFLLICLAAFWWGTRPTMIGRRHAVIVFAWLCAALAATLVIFSLFPDSQADGGLLGITLGGAGAFVMLVWTAAIRATKQGDRVDALERQVRDKDKALRRLREEVDQLAASRRPRPLETTETYLYRIVGTGTPRRSLAIVTGDIRRTRSAEVWVNPENTDMRMSRTEDHSISGLIRYEGARRDEAGRVVADVIADDLNRRVADRRPVPAGTVVLTGPGDLARSGVRQIAHVATVQGEPGGGFRQVREVGRCVANVLAAVADKGGGRTVLFPLLGAGQGGGQVIPTVESMANAVVGYFTTVDDTSIETVYFLAYTDAELLACRSVLDAMPQLARSAAPRHG